MSGIAPILGKRASQKKEVRKRLMNEGLALFSSHGLEKTTIADIVENTKIARGTFYNYFADTQTLFDAIIDELNQSVKTVIQKTRRESKNIYDYLYGAFKSYFDLIGTSEMIQFHILNQAQKLVNSKNNMRASSAQP